MQEGVLPNRFTTASKPSRAIDLITIQRAQRPDYLLTSTMMFPRYVFNAAKFYLRVGAHYLTSISPV